ncbi:hypothetical protein HJD18_01830 [Thermoleophilia bacterium SCSIO 60948]|nr:hypothetical protein HJD18_01830 [Thermoleophilia bacterium SCSIO 60948]
MKKMMLIIGVLVVSLGVTAAVQAKPKSDFKTKVTIKSDNSGPYSEGFTGKVRAKGPGPAGLKRQCKAGRRVTVVLRGSGPVGSDVTNRRGQYAVPARGDYAEPGRYFAKAKRKSLRGPRDCKPGKSRTITVAGA